MVVTNLIDTMESSTYSNVMTGREFNKSHPGKYYKLLVKTPQSWSWIKPWTWFDTSAATAAEYKINNYVFSDGLNVDTVPFHPTLDRYSGGMHFSSIQIALVSGETKFTHIAEVSVPDDANVLIGMIDYKADKLILKLNECRPICDVQCDYLKK